MANEFKVIGTSIADTHLNTILTAGAESTFIVGSIIIANTTAGTDSTVDLYINDSDQSTDYQILTDEAINRTVSREILSRPLVLENGDALKIQAANANVYDVIISYLDRNRN